MGHNLAWLTRLRGKSDTVSGSTEATQRADIRKQSTGNGLCALSAVAVFFIYE